MLRSLRGLLLVGLTFVSGAQAQVPPSPSPILASIRSTHHMACGTVLSADDWNGEDLHGNLSALGSEICRAVAIAILGSADDLTVTPFPAEPEALAAVKSDAVHLVVGVTPSTTTARQFDVAFGQPVFYDSQRMMVSRLAGITDLAGLRDKLICVLNGTPPERTLRDEFTARHITYALAAHSEQGEMDAAVAIRHCVAGTAMETRLAQSRANFHARTADFVFLPERLTINPVVPAYRYGDQAFGLIVDWAISALIEAEALGITQANVAQAMEREDMRAEQLLGHDFATAQALGLAHDWAAKMIAATGNYGEIFRRTTGEPYHIERGLNALWTDGGLMRPWPMK